MKLHLLCEAVPGLPASDAPTGKGVRSGDELANAIKSDRALLRHFSTLHDAYYRGDSSLTGKDSKVAMEAIMQALWNKVPEIKELGVMQPEPHVPAWVELLDGVGEGPLGEFFGFKGPEDVPDEHDYLAPDEEDEEPVAEQPPVRP